MTFTRLSLFIVGFVTACQGWTIQAAEPQADARKFFENRVRPLLAEKCFKCHDERKQRGGLRLDIREGVFSGGESGEVLKPGKPDESLLIQAIRYESFEMPPDGKLSAEEIATLTQWVAAGAYWPDEPKSTGTGTARKGGGHGISDEDKKWWAFQPLAEVAAPQIENDAWSRNEIDRFILSRLKREDISPAPEASRATLIRRLYFDLTGLPPSPEDVEAFVKDESPKAYEQLVDRLLASPRYGERWARQWFDLIRYNESDGYRKDDYRPDMWRYRDYVISSLNSDKPFSQFASEQIAGDELDPLNPDARVATGYWRLYLYEYNQRDARTHWQAILDELTDVTGEVFFGFSIGCAKCHDHKFDPILREDYFRLQAHFSSILPQDSLPVAKADELAAHNKKLAEWEQATKAIRDEIEKIRAPYIAKAKPGAVNKFPPDIRAIADKSPEERSAEEHQLMDLMRRQIDYEYASIKPKEDDKKRLTELNEQLAKFDSMKPAALPTAMTVTDASLTPAKTLIPGDRKQRDITPGKLTILSPEPSTIEPLATAPQSTGRRAALARWVADPQNPLTPRVVVNRIWQGHFGMGIVPTASDFGHLGEPPTHPELLDWLTRYFLSHNGQFKELHRLIVNSATYRQSATNPSPERALKVDPTTRLRWRWYVRRLDAEQVRDAMLAASGELDNELGGPSVDAGKPRRSIYLRQMRNAPDPLLYSFDATDGFNSTARRNVTTTPNQSLLMINGAFPLSRSKGFSKRVDSLVANDPAAKSDPLKAAANAAWRLAYGRLPNESELASAVHFLRSGGETQSPPDPATLTATFPVTNSPAIELNGASALPQWKLADTQQAISGDFTVEAIVQLRSIYSDTSVRTIVSQWDGDSAHRGWGLGVTSAQSKHQPRNLILQLVGDAADGKLTYEVVVSNFRLELNRPYYVAAAVQLSETSEKGITFYLKDLGDPDAVLQIASATHKVVSGIQPDFRMTMGDRDGTKRARWDGLIDQVRLSAATLQQSELIDEDGNGREVVGSWNFNTRTQLGQDQSGKGRDLTAITQPPESARSGVPQRALSDLCHVLLNSSEFLYVD